MAIVTRHILVFVTLMAHECCGLKCDMAMLKAALTIKLQSQQSKTYVFVAQDIYQRYLETRSQ